MGLCYAGVRLSKLQPENPQAQCAQDRIVAAAVGKIRQ